MFIIRKHFFKDISCNKWNDTYLLSNAFLFHCSVWLIYVYTMSDIAPSIQIEWNVCRLRRNHVPLKKWSNFYLSRQVKTWGLRIHKSGRMKAHHRKVKNTFSLLAKDLATTFRIPLLCYLLKNRVVLRTIQFNNPLEDKGQQDVSTPRPFPLGILTHLIKGICQFQRTYDFFNLSTSIWSS